MKESAIVRQCSSYLKARNIIHWKNHILNGWFRNNKKQREYWVTTGLVGLADMSIMLDNKIVFIEYKTPKGKQTPEQKDFERECIKRNIPYIIVRDINDLIEFLEITGGKN